MKFSHEPRRIDCLPHNRAVQRLRMGGLGRGSLGGAVMAKHGMSRDQRDVNMFVRKG